MYLVNTTTNCNPTSINGNLLFPYQEQSQHQTPSKTIIQDTIDRVCRARRISRELVIGKSRKREICETRQMICYIMKYDTRLNVKLKIGLRDIALKNIANSINMKDHSSVIYSINAMQRLIDTDKFFRAQVADLQRLIYNS